MARRTTKKKGPTPEEEAKEFFTALDMIEEEKGISKAYMMEKITQALVSAYKRDHEGAEENIVVLTSAAPMPAPAVAPRISGETIGFRIVP